MEAMPGYLSLHQTPVGLVIKWTPNQLMNGCTPSVSEGPNDVSSNGHDKRYFINEILCQNSTKAFKLIDFYSQMKIIYTQNY
jgi:hypothetical protein